jgi:hypothetical protein
VSAGAETLARRFRLAAREFAETAPLYERLSYVLADRPDLCRPLLAAPPQQQRALLFFAAVSQILRTVDPDHPLAQWFPVLGGHRDADDGDPGAALEDLVTVHSDEITRLCRTRNTQTNEARRAALIRPALGIAARRFGKPLALIELGASAGLLLVPDRYAYHYFNLRTGRDEVYDDGFQIDCEARAGWPTPAAEPFEVGTRVGIDLAPIRPDDTDGVNWLRSCVWPEHVDRVARLDAALDLVRAEQPKLIAGDFTHELPRVLSSVEPGSTPFVFTSHALAYLGSADRTQLLRLWHDFGSTRDLVVVVNENPVVGLHMFAPQARVESDLRTPIVAVIWQGGQASVKVLAEGGPHGNYLHYQPQEYAFEPPLLGA